MSEEHRKREHSDPKMSSSPQHSLNSSINSAYFLSSHLTTENHDLLKLAQDTINNKEEDIGENNQEKLDNIETNELSEDNKRLKLETLEDIVNELNEESKTYFPDIVRNSILAATTIQKYWRKHYIKKQLKISNKDNTSSDLDDNNINVDENNKTVFYINNDDNESNKLINDVNIKKENEIHNTINEHNNIQNEEISPTQDSNKNINNKQVDNLTQEQNEKFLKKEVIAETNKENDNLADENINKLKNFDLLVQDHSDQTNVDILQLDDVRIDSAIQNRIFSPSSVVSDVVNEIHGTETIRVLDFDTVMYMGNKIRLSSDSYKKKNSKSFIFYKNNC